MRPLTQYMGHNYRCAAGDVNGISDECVIQRKMLPDDATCQAKRLSSCSHSVMNNLTL